MSGPQKSSSLSDKTRDLLVYVELLRQQAAEFRKTLEEEIQVTRAQILEELARQAKAGAMTDEWTKVI